MNFKYCMLLQIYQYVNILSLLHKSIKYLSPLVFQNFIFLKLKGVTQSICLETKEIWKKKEPIKDPISKQYLPPFIFQNLIFLQIQRWSTTNPKTFDRIHDSKKGKHKRRKTSSLEQYSSPSILGKLNPFPDSKCTSTTQMPQERFKRERKHEDKNIFSKEIRNEREERQVRWKRSTNDTLFEATFLFD